MNKRIAGVICAALLMMSASAVLTASAEKAEISPTVAASTIDLDSGKTESANIEFSTYNGTKSPNTGVPATVAMLPIAFASLAAMSAIISSKKSDEE